MKKSLSLFLLVSLLLGLGAAPSNSLAQRGPTTPVPAKAEQDKAMKRLLGIFADDWARATTREARAKEAAYLFEQGKDVKDEPAIRFVCFREARDMAAKAGDTNLAMAIIDETSRQFDVDAFLLKADVLGLAVASATEKEQGLALVEVIRPLLNEAVEFDNYKAAHQLGDTIIAAAKKGEKLSLVLELQKRIEEIKGIEKSFGKVQGYLDRVQKDPKDAQAQLELGKYFAYQKKRWEKALPYFARSGDKAMEVLAKQDLTDPKDYKDQLVLADGWWDLGENHKDAARLAIQMRAAHWYDKTLPSTVGINHTKAQARIAKVQDAIAGTQTTTAPAAVGPVGEARKFEGHIEEIKGVAFSHDGRFVASASRDMSVRVWDTNAKDGKETTIIKGHTKEVWSVGFHPNNRYLLSASWDGTARMWDFKAGTEVKQFKHAKDVNGLALSRDGSQLLTGSDDEKVYLWNANTGEEIRRYTGHSNYVYAVAFSPDGRYVASGGVDKSVRVFNLATGQLVKTFDGHSEAVTNVAFTSDSRIVLSSGDSTIHRWNVETGKAAPRLFEGQHSGRIPAMAVSADGRRMATGGDDRTIKIWDVDTGKMLHSFTGHTDTILCVAFSQDGRRLVSGSYDKSVRVWNLPPR